MSVQIKHTDGQTSTIKSNTIHMTAHGITLDGSKSSIPTYNISEINLPYLHNSLMRINYNRDENRYKSNSPLIYTSNDSVYLHDLKCVVKTSDLKLKFDMYRNLDLAMRDMCNRSNVVTFTTKLYDHQFSIFNLDAPNATISIKDNILLLSHGDHFNNVLDDLSDVNINELDTLMISSDDVRVIIPLDEVSSIYASSGNDIYQLHSNKYKLEYPEVTIVNTHVVTLSCNYSSNILNMNQYKLVYDAVHPHNNTGKNAIVRFLSTVLSNNSDPVSIDGKFISETPNDYTIAVSLYGTICNITIPRHNHDVLIDRI